MKPLQADGREELPGRLERILQKHKGQAGALIPVLQEIQRHYGYISRRHMSLVADYLGIPTSTVFGVASFYAQFCLQPRGEHVIRVCQGTACHVRGSDKVLEAFAAELGIRPGETSGDGKFGLESVSCLGACGLAPTAMIGEKTYGRLTPGKVREILAAYRDKQG